MEIISAKKENLSIILKALKNGKVLIFPTDTVYGLICDATEEKAVERIFKIKKRKRTNPLAVFVKDVKAAKRISYINKEQEDFLKKNWPGAVTVILKSRKRLSKLVYKKGTIGIRVPDYKLLNLVLEKFRRPIAQTSANISGRGATGEIDKVLKQFSGKDRPDLAINAGNLAGSDPSKVFIFIDKPTRIR
ncbi:MAG: L-threonylcarbamoyladenylate synthase [Candidatus Staskawiczbacteria bacterium]|jgi:L-threonylcarbamoyladenylate synthase